MYLVIQFFLNSNYPSLPTSKSIFPIDANTQVKQNDFIKFNNKLNENYMLKMNQNFKDSIAKKAFHFSSNYMGNGLSFGNNTGPTTNPLASLATAVSNYQNHYNYMSNSAQENSVKSENDLGQFSLSVLKEIISWSKSIQLLKKLSVSVQSDLLVSTWSELFILSLAKSDFCVRNFIGDALSNEERESIGGHEKERPRHFLVHFDAFKKVQMLVDNIRNLDLSTEEYNHLRAIVLFNTGKW